MHEAFWRRMCVIFIRVLFPSPLFERNVVRDNRILHETLKRDTIIRRIVIRLRPK